MQAFEQNPHDAVAAQAQPPHDVLVAARVILDDTRRARRDNLSGALHRIALKTAAANSADRLPAFCNQHTRAGPPVGRADDTDDRRQRRAFAARPRVGVSLDDCLQFVHESAPFPISLSGVIGRSRTRTPVA